MDMTLDEAIKHAEEVAEEKEQYRDLRKLRLDNRNDYSNIVHYQTACKCAEEHRQLAEWLKELKQLREQSKWIPVIERLPESNGVYIVTREFTDGFECADLTDACYFDGTSTWHDDNRINHGREYVDKKIKAWMPLPEPYKAERSGEESAIRTT